jgi:hypothetical protein
VRKYLAVIFAVAALAVSVPAGALAGGSDRGGSWGVTISFTCSAADGKATYVVSLNGRAIASATVRGNCVAASGAFSSLQDVLNFLRSLHP